MTDKWWRILTVCCKQLNKEEHNIRRSFGLIFHLKWQISLKIFGGVKIVRSFTTTKFATPLNNAQQGEVSEMMYLGRCRINDNRTRLHPIRTAGESFFGEHRDNWLTHDMTENQRKRAYGVISCLIYLCTAIKAEDKTKQNILDLFTAHPNIPIHMLGFTGDWKEQPLWR